LDHVYTHVRTLPIGLVLFDADGLSVGPSVG